MHNALGRRTKRTQGTTTTKFIYDGQDVLSDDNAGTLTKYLNGLGIDNKLRQTTGSSISYFLTDHLGSTNGLADSSGSLTASTSYDSFGNATNTSFPTRYQYTGREFDSFTGLHYYRARWYDAKLGRFISEDPIGLSGGINQFAYVGNNSQNATDPTGLYEIDVHYYLTYYLAKKTGCFSDGQARAIANNDEGTDEDESTLPAFDHRYANSTYHALNDEASAGAGSQHLWDMATRPYPDFVYFGRYLHYLQDTYSHSGFTNSTYGHARAGHYYDKTSSDPARSVRMAISTWNALGNFAKTLGCECEPKWTPEIGQAVADFSSAPGSTTPSLNTIDSTGGVLDFFKTNPRSFLENKKRILGIY